MNIFSKKNNIYKPENTSPMTSACQQECQKTKDIMKGDLEIATIKILLILSSYFRVSDE